MTEKLPDYLFSRQDESGDENFYAMPRFVTHIDDDTIAAVTDYYREVLPASGHLLDLMSSWVSHLPPEIEYSRVVGLGMNAEELDANKQLDESLVHNLNAQPALPWPDQTFDAVMIVVSIQYLQQPFEVFAEIQRVLKADGQCIVAMSHRLFPTKAIYAFTSLGPNDRFNLVTHYMQAAGMTDIRFIDRSPDAADPLWIINGKRGRD